jgi:putative transposase
MSVSDAKRLKQLEDENAKLKKLLAEAMLDSKRLTGITGTLANPLTSSGSRCGSIPCVVARSLLSARKGDSIGANKPRSDGR